jgi:hypothetical protein
MNIERNPTRVAGTLLLIGSGLALITWAVQWRWGWTPLELAVAEAAMEAVLGIGLLRFGRTWTLPTLTFLTMTVVLSCVQTAVQTSWVFSESGIANFLTVLSVPLMLGALRLAPFLLLLTGKQTNVRYRAAIVVFALQQLIEIAVAGLAVFVGEWMATRRAH